MVQLEWSDSEFTYNKTERIVTATVTNALQGDEVKLIYEGNSNKGTNAGGYEAKVIRVENSNYSLTDESGNPVAEISKPWKIKPIEITVKAHNLSKHIGKPEPDFAGEYDADGIMPDDKIYGVQLKREEGEEAGEYAIKVTISEDGDLHNTKHHRNLCYESSNTEVATVASKGLIQAKGKGTCKIWVYAQNGVYKELTITVK